MYSIRWMCRMGSMNIVFGTYDSILDLAAKFDIKLMLYFKVADPFGYFLTKEQMECSSSFIYWLLPDEDFPAR